MTSGCYVFRHTPTGKFYIGSSINVAKRLRHHANKIRLGKHENENVRSLGTNVDDFEFRVLLVCAPEDRLMYEDRLLGLHQNNPDFLNLQYSGHAPSDAARAKIAASRRGKKRPPFSAEWRERMGAATRGKPRSAEWREKHRAGMARRVVPPESQARVIAAHKGAKRSEEARAKMREAHQARPKPLRCGKGHPFNEENTYWWTSKEGRTKRRCKACDKARPKSKPKPRPRMVGPRKPPPRPTAATRAIWSRNRRGEGNPRYGVKLSPELRAKISEAVKARMNTPEMREKIRLGRERRSAA